MNMNYEAPRTKEEWWKLYSENKSKIYPIMYAVLNPRHEAYEIPGDANSPTTGRDISNEIEFLEKNKDYNLTHYLEATWNLTSDVRASEYLHNGRSGWLILCDLCSERYVLQEYDENQE